MRLFVLGNRSRRRLREDIGEGDGTRGDASESMGSLNYFSIGGIAQKGHNLSRFEARKRSFGC